LQINCLVYWHKKKKRTNADKNLYSRAVEQKKFTFAVALAYKKILLNRISRKFNQKLF